MKITLNDVEAKLKKVREATEFPSKIENEETRFALIATVQAIEYLSSAVKDVRNDIDKLRADFEAHKNRPRGLQGLLETVKAKAR